MNDTKLYIVGGGMAGLSAAIFAVRDAHVPGNNITIFEVLDHEGGSLYGEGEPGQFYFTRGDWKFGAKTHNCLWDALSGIPSLDDPGQSVMDEIIQYNKTHKKDARSRLIHANCRRDNVESMGLSWKQRKRLIQLIFTKEEKIENQRIDSWFDPSFFGSSAEFVGKST